MSAISINEFSAARRSDWTVSALAHLMLLGALSSGAFFIPAAPLQPMAIEAVLIDEGAIQRAAERELELQRQVERERAAELERQAEIDRQRKAEQERVAAEQRRREEADALRLRQEQERKAREAEAAEQQRREAAALAERQRKEAAERERQARIAAAEQKALEQRQAELRAAMEAEEALLAARSSGELNEYMGLIQQRVQRSWVQPLSAVPGIECAVRVQQLPSGEVIDARVTRCNGDVTVRRSVEDAIYAASPLPLPSNRALFERYIEFTFKPRLD